ncbi:hypothetical protein EDD11_003441 [Mortierella claussenii]|nr:hypothetical protein EDD11_003441 [Mortierella claussenii]
MAVILLSWAQKREAFEEVRLEPSESQLLTLLPPVLSRHMQVVTPVVVYCPNLTTSDVLTQLYPNPGEVAAIFTSPLEYFLSPRPQDYHWFDMNWTISDHRIHRFERCGANNYILGESESEKHIEERNYSSSEGISSSSLADRSDVGWPVYGLTAGVLVEVAKIAYRREPDFEMFAPAQIQDESEMAKWYNSKYGTLRSPL